MAALALALVFVLVFLCFVLRELELAIWLYCIVLYIGDGECTEYYVSQADAAKPNKKTKKDGLFPFLSDQMGNQTANGRMGGMGIRGGLVLYVAECCLYYSRSFGKRETDGVLGFPTLWSTS